MKRNQKWLVLLMAAVMACSAAACTSGGKSESSAPASSAASQKDEKSSASSEDSKKEESTASETGRESAEPSESKPAEADLSRIDIEIAFGDYDAIRSFNNNISSYVGKVVKVAGLNAAGMFSCSIMEKNEEAGESFGRTYTVEGWDKVEQYPADGARIEVLGVVALNEYGVEVISVKPENVKVLDEESAPAEEPEDSMESEDAPEPEDDPEAGLSGEDEGLSEPEAPEEELPDEETPDEDEGTEE